MKNNRLLVVIVGPTAIGKTALSIELARRFNADILSADSRQFFKEMEIGTAKPSSQELAQAPHHFINSHSIKHEYDAVSFADDAEKILHKLFEKNDIQIMVGGSGLYVKAFCEGLDEMPQTDLTIRSALKEQLKSEGLDSLLVELQQKDPDFYDKIDKANSQRIIRALEVIRESGKPYSTFRKDYQGKQHDFKILKIGLEMDRETMYERINERMDAMLEMGLLNEAKNLYPHRTKNALQTVGYKELFDFIEEKYDFDEAKRLLKRNSRRYAKRQLTWFKKDESIHWFNPSNMTDILKLIESKIS